MKKIIFLDVDGTLVDYENKIPKSAIEAIRLARKMDIEYIFVQEEVKQKYIKNFGILD